MQANSLLGVQIVETDFPQIREVDLKLIELAKGHRREDCHQRFQPEQSGAPAPRLRADINDLAELTQASRVCPAKR